MTSRLDRLFALLEHCPNATLREAAADQLGQLARKAPTEVDATLTRLHGLLRSRSWNSRIAAAEAIRAMVNHLPAWKPRPPVSLMLEVSLEVVGETAAGAGGTPTSATFLSLSALRLDRVLANGARLYSMDARELSNATTGRPGPLTHQSKAKRARKSFSQETDELSSASAKGLEIDREELNRRIGLIGDTYLSSILAEHSGTSVKDLISEEDLQMDCENSDRLSVDVMKSVKEAYANVEGAEKQKLSEQDEIECSTDWPLNAFCVRLLADLWDLRWETRHGAASGLRELLSDKRQTKQAGKRHGATEAENDRANRVYLEDILVRVLCTLALDQFSDFICDEVVAPVRETAAQVLGVLASHLDMDQVKEVIRHLLGMMSMHEAGSAAGSTCFFSKTSWMAVHSGLLGLKYLLASRQDLCDQLLPLVCPSIVSALIGGGGSSLPGHLTVAVPAPTLSSSSSAGEDDIRAAAAAALLAISDTVACYEPDAATWESLSRLALPSQAHLTARTGFCDWLMHQLWDLLTSSHELCPATGPLLALASKLLRMGAKEPPCPIVATVSAVPVGLKEPAAEPQQEDNFVRHVRLVLRFMHHSSSSIRKSAILALQSLVSTRITQGTTIDLVSLELIFDQLFHRVILEPQVSLIQLLSQFWVRMVAVSPLPVLVSATLHHVDFWLCQTMQPTSMPYPDHLLRLPAAVGGAGTTNTAAEPSQSVAPSSQPHPTPSRVKYIGGREALTVSEAERQTAALETRLTAVALLACLCRRLCESSMSVLLGNNSSSEIDTGNQPTATPEQGTQMSLPPPPNQSGGLPVAAYLLGHLLTEVHFKDRLAMQRFLAGLLLAAWPSPAPYTCNTALRMFSPAAQPGELDAVLSSLQARLQLCLTDVTYYEEILGLFRLMQDECRRLLSLSNAAGIFADGSAPTSGGVLNIVQCQSILKVVATKLASLETPPGEVRPLAASPTSPNRDTARRNGQQSPDCAMPDLTSAFRQAELSVARCLSLQLFWSSRVELSVASAMVNLGWVLPGRLTLFIRPFMETIRAGDVSSVPSSGPVTDSNGTASVLDLPSTATSLRLQCLAADNLARLLWLEYCRETSSSTPTGRNPSKALSKVIQNLTKYISSADPVIGAGGGAVAVTVNDIVSLTVTHFNLLDTNLPTTQPQSPASTFPPVLSRSRPLTTGVNLQTSSGLPFGDSFNSLQTLLRRDGSLLTLIALIRHFLGLSPSGGQSLPRQGVEAHPVDLLADGLPTLWKLVWQEPVTLLQRLFSSYSSPNTTTTPSDHSVNGDGAAPPSVAVPTGTTLESDRPREQFRLDVQFLQRSLEVSEDQRTLTGPEEDCLCQCLCLLLALFGAFRNSGAGKEQAADELIAGLLTLTLRLLRMREARPRYAAAHALAMAVWFWPSRVLNIILLDCLPRLDVEEQSKSRICCLTEQMAAMESIYHVIEGVTSSIHEVFISNLPVDRPLTPELHGYHHLSDLQQQTDLQALRPDDRPTDLEVSAASPTTVNSAYPTDCVQSPLRVLISYVVVILTAMLHRLADPRADVRALASRIFTKLLVLLPLEESLPDCREMHPRLVIARTKGREFVQCLLHPSSIKLFSNKTYVKAELRPYQKEGVNWLLFLQKYGLNGILADDLGLGKTLQTICVLVSHHRSRRKRGGGASLVVCPATLCSHWLHEIAKFAEPRCGLHPIIYQGTLDQRQQLQSTLLDYNIVITTYDLVRNDLYFFEETFWEYLILDEGHMIKNSKSKLTCAAKRLRARHRLLLTGTPVQNRVVEIWSLFDFLMPGFLGTEASFASRFARPIASSRDPKASPEEQRAGQLALEHLHRIVLPFILRRLKEDVLQDLPPKVIQDYICNMTPLQQKLYASFARTADGQHALDLADRKCQSVGGTRPPASESSVAPVLTDSAPADVRHHGFQSMKYLLSVCNHPCLVLRANHPLLTWAQERMQIEWSVDSLEAVSLSGKLVALRQLLFDCGFGGVQRLSTFDSSNVSSSLNLQEELMSQHRALIFFQTKSMLKLVAKMLNSEFPTITYVKLDGTVPISERHGTVTRFNQDPSIDILLLTTSIGGLGLNLTGADTVIFVEHDWNPCKDLQAMDRAHRIGQQRMVNVYRLITADSIEERIMSLQVFKLHIARTVVSEENQSIADTGRIFDNLVSCSPVTGALSASFGGNGGDNAEWGDTEASQYADEFDLAAFVSRHVSQPLASEQEAAEVVAGAGED